jgi:cytochrome c oxidase cbb3-type subunit 1
MTLMLLGGGFVQGINMNDPSIAFSESTQSILPYLRGRSIAGVLMMVAHFVFAFHFGLMLFGLGRTASVPTFLNPIEPEGAEPHL